MDYAWTCSCCGRQLGTLPLDFGCSAPDHWLALGEEERRQTGRLDSDVCRIGDDLFVRGCLEIPIRDYHDSFVYGAWVSVSLESMDRIVALWDAETIAEDEPPRFGWLCNNLKLYPPTLGLKTHLHIRRRGLRPSLELEPTDHPLAVEQRDGITLARVQKIAAALLQRH